ncbi:MAG TPA: patatin-like phospholipase family protein [Gemmatimonadales bacterium]|nr:patatin-like phospholipase family protein [Gemmatimonadales bacterium]
MRVVAAFGGGGAKSLAHAGAWKALLEAGLTPSHIVGTSLGAVIGAAFAAGSTYEGLVAAALSLQAKDVAALHVWSLAKGVFAGSILKPEPLKRTIARLVPAARFADLMTPLTVTATDLDSGELVLFGALGQDAPLVDALYASCALPLYFPPQQLDGRRLADGGLRAVVPLDVARRVTADLVVAIDVGPGFDEPPADRKAAVPPLVRAHGEAIRVMMAAQTERAIAAWPKDGPRLILVRAVAEREATFAVGAGERYVKAGYDATKRALDDRLNA